MSSGVWKVSVDKGTWTVKSNGYTNPVIVVDTIKVYVATMVKQISATLDNNSWETISEVSQNGQASQYWSVGDKKAVVLNGQTTSVTYDNLQIYAFIIGIKHNSIEEQHYRNGLIHFQFGKIINALTAFCDDEYLERIFNDSYNMNTESDNAGGWKSSYMRLTLLGNSGVPNNPPKQSFLSVIPQSLATHIRPVLKYTDNVGDGSTSYSAVTLTTDYLFLLAEYEVFGTKKYSNQYEYEGQTQYQYYKSGNSKVAKGIAPSYNWSSVSWWLRSPVSSSRTNFCEVYENGNLDTRGSEYSLGVCFGFCI